MTATKYRIDDREWDSFRLELERTKEDRIKEAVSDLPSKPGPKLQPPSMEIESKSDRPSKRKSTDSSLSSSDPVMSKHEREELRIRKMMEDVQRQKAQLKFERNEFERNKAERKRMESVRHRSTTLRAERSHSKMLSKDAEVKQIRKKLARMRVQMDCERVSVMNAVKKERQRLKLEKQHYETQLNRERQEFEKRTQKQKSKMDKFLAYKRRMEGMDSARRKSMALDLNAERDELHKKTEMIQIQRQELRQMTNEMWAVHRKLIKGVQRARNKLECNPQTEIIEKEREILKSEKVRLEHMASELEREKQRIEFEKEEFRRTLCNQREQFRVQKEEMKALFTAFQAQKQQMNVQIEKGQFEKQLKERGEFKRIQNSQQQRVPVRSGKMRIYADKLEEKHKVSFVQKLASTQPQGESQECAASDNNRVYQDIVQSATGGTAIGITDGSDIDIGWNTPHSLSSHVLNHFEETFTSDESVSNQQLTQEEPDNDSTCAFPKQSITATQGAQKMDHLQKALKTGMRLREKLMAEPMQLVRGHDTTFPINNI